MKLAGKLFRDLERFDEAAACFIRVECLGQAYDCYCKGKQYFQALQLAANHKGLRQRGLALINDKDSVSQTAAFELRAIFLDGAADKVFQEGGKAAVPEALHFLSKMREDAEDYQRRFLER